MRAEAKLAQNLANASRRGQLTAAQEAGVKELEEEAAQEEAHVAAQPVLEVMEEVRGLGRLPRWLGAKRDLAGFPVEHQAAMRA